MCCVSCQINNIDGSGKEEENKVLERSDKDQVQELEANWTKPLAEVSPAIIFHRPFVAVFARDIPNIIFFGRELNML